MDTFAAGEAIDLRAMQADIVDLEGKLADVKNRMADYLKELGLD